MDKLDIWNKQKKIITNEIKFSHPKERDIWWVRVGLNVGTEIYGKGDIFLIRLEYLM